VVHGLETIKRMNARTEPEVVGDEPTCSACGVPFSEHLGLQGTCQKLIELRAIVGHPNMLREIEVLKAQLAASERQNEKLIEVVEALANAWRYGYGEIEAACGGVVAQQVQKAVLARRGRIKAMLEE